MKMEKIENGRKGCYYVLRWFECGFCDKKIEKELIFLKIK